MAEPVANLRRCSGVIHPDHAAQYREHMVHRRTYLAAAVALGLTLAGTAAAGAEPDWRKVPHSAEDASLNDIAVIDGADAWTVGERLPPGAIGHPVAEHWDGTSWNVVSLPDTPTGGGSLDGVAAVSSDDVWAVGDSSGQGPVIRHWNGTDWAAVAPASPPGNQHPGADRLYDVSAVEQGPVWAVGSFSDWDEPGPVTLVERWDGQAWSRVPAPNPGRMDNILRGVAAVSATDAWAVGWYFDDEKNVALALHWDGQAWTRSPMSLPPGNTELEDVTAVSAHDVWAVGTNEGRPLTLHWDGSAWHLLPAPSVTEAWPQTVATDGQGGAWVGGYHMTDDGTVSRPLFLHWNGSVWATGTSEEPEGVVYGLAPAGASIWAVGTTSPCSCFVAPPLVEVNGPVLGRAAQDRPRSLG